MRWFIKSQKKKITYESSSFVKYIFNAFETTIISVFLTENQKYIRMFEINKSVNEVYVSQ